MLGWIARAMLFRVLPRRLIPAIAVGEFALLVLRARRDRRAKAKRVLESGDDRRRTTSPPA
jgi:hypothetical protein